MRTYKVSLGAQATVVVDEGRVELEVDLVNLPWEIEHDAFASYTAAEIEADKEVIGQAFLSSPFNHSLSAALKVE